MIFLHDPAAAVQPLNLRFRRFASGSTHRLLPKPSTNYPRLGMNLMKFKHRNCSLPKLSIVRSATKSLRSPQDPQLQFFTILSSHGQCTDVSSRPQTARHSHRALLLNHAIFRPRFHCPCEWICCSKLAQNRILKIRILRLSINFVPHSTWELDKFIGVGIHLVKAFSKVVALLAGIIDVVNQGLVVLSSSSLLRTSVKIYF